MLPVTFFAQTFKDAETYEAERLKREASRQKKRGASGSATASRRSSVYNAATPLRRAGSVGADSDGGRCGLRLLELFVGLQ